MLERARDAGRDQVLRRREEHRHETADHEVVELLFGFGKPFRRLQRRDDREVIADLGVVENAAAWLDVIVRQRGPGVRRQMGHAAVGEHLEGFPDDRQVVLGQRARIGSRVGERLVPLVQALRNRKRGLGREAEPAVRLALQRREVEQERARLGRRLRFLGDDGALAADGIRNRLGLAFGPDAIRFQFSVFVALLPRGIEPFARIFARVGAKARMDLPIVAADKFADPLLALDHDGKRWRLHSPHRRQEEATVAGVERGHRPRAVDADQPVGFGAGSRRVGESVHLIVAAEGGEPVANRLGGHRLEPQPADRLAKRLLRPGELFDQSEDQLAFSPGVTRVHEFGHVLAAGLANDGTQPRLGPFHGLQVEVGGNDRQVRKAPLAALDVEFFRCMDLQQVPDGARDHVGIVFEVILVFLELSGHRCERADDVLRHRGLFRYHQTSSP